MTIRDAQAKRDELELTILNLIGQFEKETALSVEKIDIQHGKVMGSTQKFTVAVSIPVYIS